MKSRIVLSTVVLAMIAAGSIPALAQQAGFQVGVGRPGFGFPSPAPAAPSPHGTFQMVPPVGVMPTPIPQIPLVPNFPTVIVPNVVLVPGQTILPITPVIATPVVVTPNTPVAVAVPFPGQFGPAGHIPPAGQFAPVGPFAPVSQFGFPVVRGVAGGLPIGAPRAEVLRVFGQPSVTVITSTGETLYFTGGTTVLIQNGRVAGPR